MLNFLNICIILVCLLAKIIHGNRDIKASFFEMIANTDIIGLQPIETAIDKQAPHQCSSKCNRNDLCDAFTTTSSDPNNGQGICKLYAVLRDNKCIANVTQVPSVGTAFYKKRNKGINVNCKATKECTTLYGLQCIRGKCSCNQTQ